MFKSLRAKLSNIRKDIGDIYKFIKDTLLPIITNGLDESVGRFTDTLAKLRVSITEAVKTFLTDTVEDARESRRDVSIVITKLIEFVNSKLPQDEKREQLKAFLGYVSGGRAINPPSDKPLTIVIEAGETKINALVKALSFTMNEDESIKDYYAISYDVMGVPTDNTGDKRAELKAKGILYLGSLRAEDIVTVKDIVINDNRK